MSQLDSERAIGQQLRKSEGHIPLRGGRQVVGRAPDCDIVLPHPTVSRRHAELAVGSSIITVLDLGSRNGTRVNEARIEQVVVRRSDRLQFGALEFHVEECPPKLIPWVERDESTTAQVQAANIKHSSPTLVLSPARQRVLDCLLEGLSEKQIAARLDVSVHTIHNQVRDIYRQFAVNSRAELLASFLPRPE